MRRVRRPVGFSSAGQGKPFLCGVWPRTRDTRVNPFLSHERVSHITRSGDSGKFMSERLHVSRANPTRVAPQQSSQSQSSHIKQKRASRVQPHAPTSRTGRADRCDDNRRHRGHPALRPGSSYTSKENPPKKGTQSDVHNRFLLFAAGINS